MNQDEMYAMMEREMMDEYYDRFAPVATMSDAHAEWHRNSGNPMGTPGCPMDACHIPDDPDYWTEDEPITEEEHRAHFGWDAVEEGAQWERDNPPF